MTRPAWIDIDLDAVAHNVEVVRAAVAPAEVCAVVKADAYGHGAVPLARAMLRAGATRLAVALPEEGIELRGAGIDAPILVLSEPGGGRWGMCSCAGLEPTVASAGGVSAAIASASGLRVHLKVDTGMHRIGVRPDDAVTAVERLVDAAGLELVSVWTHLAVADDPDHPFTAVQLDRYERVLAAIRAAGIEVPLRHAANSAGALIHPAARYDLVRCGIALYGIAPSRAAEPWCTALRPVLSVRAHITHVQHVEAGEGISYGLRHVFDRPALVATLPLGYADGIARRAFTEGGAVMVSGSRCPIVGAVTMDQLMIEVPGGTAVGDEAVVVGPGVSATDWADRLGTIPYEITCGLARRLPRRPS